MAKTNQCNRSQMMELELGAIEWEGTQTYGSMKIFNIFFWVVVVSVCKYANMHKPVYFLSI